MTRRYQLRRDRFRINLTKAAGCADIHEEHASGGNRARPVLARVLERIKKGDTLVVVRIDRLARSLSHLLEIIERLEAKGGVYNLNVEISRDTTTLYASDRDDFLFLVDDHNPIEVQKACVVLGLMLHDLIIVGAGAEIIFTGMDWQSKAQIDRRVGFEQAVEALVCDFLSDTQGGWENDDGAYVEFCFDARARSIHLEFNERFTSSELFAHDF